MSNDKICKAFINELASGRFSSEEYFHFLEKTLQTNSASVRLLREEVERQLKKLEEAFGDNGFPQKLAALMSSYEFLRENVRFGPGSACDLMVKYLSELSLELLSSDRDQKLSRLSILSFHLYGVVPFSILCALTDEFSDRLLVKDQKLFTLLAGSSIAFLDVSYLSSKPDLVLCAYSGHTAFNNFAFGCETAITLDAARPNIFGPYSAVDLRSKAMSIPLDQAICYELAMSCSGDKQCQKVIFDTCLRAISTTSIEFLKKYEATT